MRFALLVTAMPLCALPLCAQGQTPIFRATSELVQADVQVLHNQTGTPGPKGRLIPDIPQGIGPDPVA